MSDQKEKRKYFRIDDVIGLTYSKLEDGPADHTDNGYEMGMTVNSLYSEIERKFNQLSNIITEENPLVAQALGLLNQKLSILETQSLQTGSQQHCYEQLTVSLSGCGIAFHCAEPLERGCRLIVSVMLKPSNSVLNFTVTVVSCKMESSHADHPYWARVSIDEGNSLAREQLIQHVVQKQHSHIDTTID